MEAAVTNLLAPGDHAIFVNGGKFGERWGKLLAANAMTGHEITVEWGRAVRPDQIEEALRAHPRGARAVRASERNLDLRDSSGGRDRRADAGGAT